VPDRSTFRHEAADASTGLLFWKVTVLWQRRLGLVLDRLGITQTQYAILASLRWFGLRGEPTTQAHLVEHTRLDKMTLSRAIRQLETAGLLARAPSAADEAFFSRLATADRVRFEATMTSLVEDKP
jgi:DNA-binding MarR family transcriptional regulator